MIAELAIAALVYADVPADVERVAVYEWRAGGPPVPISAPVTRDAARVSVVLPAGGSAVVTMLRRDGSYLIDGPIDLQPGDVERHLDAVWRRTVQGGFEGEPVGSPAVEWLASEDARGDGWPACWPAEVARWMCMGVPLQAAGVVMALDGRRLWSAPVRTASTVLLRSSSWGRLVVVRDRGDGPPPRLKVTAARPSAPPLRPASVRVETAPLGDVRVTPVDPSSVWIAGDSSPSSAWVEVRSARSGPAYLSMGDVAEGAPQLPLRVWLDDTRAIDVLVVAERGVPAAAALVTVFRMLDPPSQPVRRAPPPRRVFAAEVFADADGRLRLEGLGDAEYEIVAWHPRFGRAALSLPAGTDRVTIHMQSPGVARGRVLAGGKPVAGVDVITVPDPAAFAAAEDPTEIKGGDAQSGADGRFAVTLAAGGGGELRVGGGTHPIKRIPLPAARLPIVELGDIELGSAVVVNVTLDQDPGCELRAAGPIGRSGLQIVGSERVAPGVFRLLIPEEGSWELSLVCGRDERGVSPAVISIAATDRPQEVRAIVR